jgi:pimeloyl-ACP methyl ester carboxylesterase
MTSRSLSVTANGLRYRVQEWGAAEEADTTVLLLHGFMDAGASWDLCAPHLLERLGGRAVRLLAPDLRGFGDTDRAPAGSYYHFADYVADVADLVEQLVSPESTFFLVGHSMGGTVATLYAGCRPERVSRLALLEGLGPPDNTFDVAPDRMRGWLNDLRRYTAREKRLLVMESLDEALARLKMNHPNVPESVLRGRAVHLLRTVEGGVEWKADPLHRTRSPSPFYAVQFREFASRVTCPVLVVDGGPQGFKTADNEERIGALRHVERAALPNAGHMMHWTEPEALGRILGSYFLHFWA